MRKKYFIIPLAVFLLLLAGLLRHLKEKESPVLFQKTESLDYTNQPLKNAASNAEIIEPLSGEIVAGITSHHLPVAEDFINLFYAQLHYSKPDIASFLIAGPDHFERCKSIVSAADLDFVTPFGKLANDKDLTAKLLDAGAGKDNSCFEEEHSIGVQAAFIKKYFPGAKVSAIVFSSAARGVMVEQFARMLAKDFPNTVLIGSMDFSHYKTAVQGRQEDETTLKQIQNQNTNFSLEQVDSPASLKMVLIYVKTRGAELKFFKQANSYDFTREVENTTGYMDLIFGK